MTHRPSHRAQYHDLFEKLLDAAFLINPETFEVLEANPSAERDFLATADQMVGHPVLKWISPSHVEEFKKAVRVSQRRFHPRQFDCHWVDVDGKPRTVETVMCMLKLADGEEVLQILAVDVTDERRAREIIANYLAQLEEVNRKLQELSTIDEMTGLSNYRRFKEELEREHQRSSRYSTPYAVVFVDADHFKIYNDKNGHLEGDKLLRKIGDALKAEVRGTDIPARYGGEEFVILCPGVDAAGAMVLAERVRERIEKFAIPYQATNPGKVVTVSLGVASFPKHAKAPLEVCNAADKALYHSKETGRNRCTNADDIDLAKDSQSAA